MNIKAKREAINISQDELGKAVGVTRSAIAMWETGKATPNANKLPLLAQTLKCNIDDLFCCESE